MIQGLGRPRNAVCAVLLFSVLISGPALAQGSLPYLDSATLYLASDGWADIWLNGIPIRESQPSTPESKGFQTIQCLPEHLCYFQNENILAIENSNAYHAPPPLDRQVGLAYILRLRFSNGSEEILTSNDVSEHRALYLPSRETVEPADWHRISFDHSRWSIPYSLGAMIPGITMLTDLGSGRGIQFLSASGTTPQVLAQGERHLYRREFRLNIGRNPVCPPLQPQVTKKPVRRIWAAVPTPPASGTFWTGPTFTAFPTPTTKPVFVWNFSPAPSPTAIPIQRTFPEPTSPPKETPTASPLQRTRVGKPAPTPIPVFGGPSRVDPIAAVAPIEPTRPDLPSLAFSPTPESNPGRAQTIVFDDQPANIYISYADGPGVYRLEVVDSSLRPLRALFEKRVVAHQDDWVEWDGKDDSGQEMAPGLYTVLFTKDGKELNKLILEKEAR